MTGRVAALAPAGRGGFALVTVVLLMIGLAVLATGLTFAAAQQAVLVRSTEDVVRARHAAQAAVGTALAGWASARRSLDPIGAPRTLLAPTELERGVTLFASVERLGADLYLVRGTGLAARPGDPPIEQHAARLVRSIDAAAYGRALDAALIAGSARLAAGSRAHGAGADPPALDSAAAALCASWPADGAALRAPPDSSAVAPGALASGSPPFLPEMEPARFLAGIGFRGVDALSREARAVAAPTLTPGPVASGAACDTAAPANWGAPSGVCAAYRPLLYAADDLVVDGGYAQGILIARGDLVLDGGTRFRGLILGLGSVTIRDAAVEGVVLAARLDMQAGSASLDRCALADALAAARPTRRAVPPARSWLPTFD